MKEKRSQIISRSGYIFIAVNFLLAVFNYLVGIISGSIAITSDAIHSLIDSASGFLIIISEKLASHHRLTEHRAKIERATTILIAIIIIAIGVHVIVESIEKIISPEDVDYSLAVIIVLIVSIVLKYLLAIYLKKTSQKTKSTVLMASNKETMNDTWISVAVLASAVIYLLFRIDIEAYISLIISLIIIKIGLEFIFPHLTHHHHHHLESDPDHDHCKKNGAANRV